MVYTPSQLILDRYADVLIRYALNGGKGVKKGEVVFLQVPEVAKPLLMSLRKATLQAGAHPIVEYLPDGMSRQFFELANKDQLTFFPEALLKGKVAQADHFLHIIAETDKHELEGIEPKKIMARSAAFKPYKTWRDDKENKGKMTWTLALYGTEAMAKEANLSIEQYWEQIINACYLNDENPVQTWRTTQKALDRIKDKLNKLPIEKLHVKSARTDITIGIGKNRQWMGGTGRNIPSFELFISPDCRVADGYVQFTEPLYRYDNLITDVYLEFKNGRVIKSRAAKGEKILKEMIAQKNADRMGEFSLTDSRFSRITKFMAETLYDENVGGKNGNTHIALGAAYKDSYPSDPSKVKQAQWEKMGYNDSIVHTDIVSTENRVVTAYLTNGKTKVIYRDGMFTV
jgi:aminopeptidase